MGGSYRVRICTSGSGLCSRHSVAWSCSFRVLNTLRLILGQAEGG